MNHFSALNNLKNGEIDDSLSSYADVTSGSRMRLSPLLNSKKMMTERANVGGVRPFRIQNQYLLASNEQYFNPPPPK